MSAKKRKPTTSEGAQNEEIRGGTESLGDVSQRALARALGVDEKALRNWLRTRSDAPPVADIEAWKKYAAEHNLGKGACNPSYAKLREEKIAVEIRLLRLKEQQARAELMEVAEVRAYLATLAAKFDQLLTQKMDTELPPRVIGKDIVAARAEIVAAHDEIRELCNAGISRFAPNK